MKRTNYLWKAEPFVFLAFVLISAIPILAHSYFPTVDGPAHLHNANLLKHYWFEQNNFILGYFDLNKHLNSNFLDHLWFAVCGLFLPGYLVEKSILIVYVVAMPFAFRYLAKQLQNNKHSALLSSYLIFPFIYSFTFRIGFFNFCIGIPLFFWTLGYWLKHRNVLSTKKTIILSVFVTLLYITHMFNFMLFGIIFMCTELQTVLSLKSIQALTKRMITPFFIFLPGLILSLLFLISNANFHHSPPIYLSKERLTNMIVELHPVITLNPEKEMFFAKIIGGVLCILLLFTGINFFKNRKHSSGFRIFWIFPALVVLLFFYLFPDWIVSGGYISIRWALYFFLMLIILIAAKGLSPQFLFLPVAALMINHLFFIEYHNEQTESLSRDAETLATAEEFMEDNKVLLPLNYSTNWIQINHAGYMATTKNIIQLDNYEPTKPHFPLIWKKGEEVYGLMPKYGNRYPPCINITAYEQFTHHHIDYLSRFYFNGDVSDSCTSLVEQELKNKFDLIYKSDDNKLVLYKRKPNT